MSEQLVHIIHLLDILQHNVQEFKNVLPMTVLLIPLIKTLPEVIMKKHYFFFNTLNPQAPVILHSVKKEMNNEATFWDLA